MIFRTSIAVPVELKAHFRARQTGSLILAGKTIEVSREQIWIACSSSQFAELPVPPAAYLVIVELPVNERVGRRCVECIADLIAVDHLDGNCVRLRFQVESMHFRDCRTVKTNPGTIENVVM